MDFSTALSRSWTEQVASFPFTRTTLWIDHGGDQNMVRTPRQKKIFYATLPYQLVVGIGRYLWEEMGHPPKVPAKPGTVVLRPNLPTIDATNRPVLPADRPTAPPESRAAIEALRTAGDSLIIALSRNHLAVLDPANSSNGLPAILWQNPPATRLTAADNRLTVTWPLTPVFPESTTLTFCLDEPQFAVAARVVPPN